MPVPWHRQLFVCSIVLQYAEACFDSSGDFFCTNLWYFWFTLFWVCMIIFVGVVCIVNRCTKRGRQVDVQFDLPRLPRTGRNGGRSGNEQPTSATPTSPTTPRTGETKTDVLS